jgi:hypothetical protein
MSGSGSIRCMATSSGIIVQMDGIESTVSLRLGRAAVAALVVQLAQADDKHQKLAGRQSTPRRKKSAP